MKEETKALWIKERTCGGREPLPVYPTAAHASVVMAASGQMVTRSNLLFLSAQSNYTSQTL